MVSQNCREIGFCYGRDSKGRTTKFAELMTNACQPSWKKGAQPHVEIEYDKFGLPQARVKAEAKQTAVSLVIAEKEESEELLEGEARTGCALASEASSVFLFLKAGRARLLQREVQQMHCIL